jgi:hypothetical protein
VFELIGCEIPHAQPEVPLGAAPQHDGERGLGGKENGNPRCIRGLRGRFSGRCWRGCHGGCLSVRTGSSAGLEPGQKGAAFCARFKGRARPVDADNGAALG